MFRSLLTLVALVGFSGSLALAQEDAVGIAGPIEYDGQSFELVWTSHPSDTFYKQEYLPAGQSLDAYEEMFMVDVLTDGPTPDVAAHSMTQSLEERKASDPVVNFEIIKNEATGEVILDFLISSDDGETMIVEWNAYRYVPVGEGLAMFGISRRAYDDDVTDFLSGLRDIRVPGIQALAGMELPEVVVE